MVAVFILPHAEFRPNEHWEDAPHFTWAAQSIFLDAGGRKSVLRWLIFKCYIIHGIGVSECSGNRGWDMVRQVARDHSPSSDLICLIP